MNGNVEVINENLWAVNKEYLKAGYIQEMTVSNDALLGQINMTDHGVVVLDTGSAYYPFLKKMFINAMNKSDQELHEIMEMNVSPDKYLGIAENIAVNVVDWEIKRRCIKAEYIASHPKPTFKDKLLRLLKF